MPTMKKATRPNGRSKPPANKQSVTVRFSPSFIERLDALAERKGTDRTAQIQLAVADWLEKEGNKP